MAIVDSHARARYGGQMDGGSEVVVPAYQTTPEDAQRLIATAPATKAFNRRHTSYGYKHAVERWWRNRGVGVYVANGSLIAAALGVSEQAA